MQRVKVQKNKEYTVISNVFLKDTNLSLKAKGLLALIMSLPDNWDFSGQGIVSIVKESETAVYSAIDELITNKYCKRTRLTEKGRFAGFEYTFFEKPNTEKPFLENPETENPETENPKMDIPNMENPNQENQGQINKEEQIKEEINKDIINKGENSFSQCEQKENLEILEVEVLEIPLENLEKEKRKKVPPKKEKKDFEPPTLQEIEAYRQAYLQKKQYPLNIHLKEPEKFLNYYTSNGWKVGKNPMKNWQASFVNWLLNSKNYGNGNITSTAKTYDPSDPYAMFER